MVRVEVLVVSVLVSPVRVVWVELGIQVGLEDLGVVEDTDEADKVEAEVATRARGRGRVGRCGLLMMFFCQKQYHYKKHIQAYGSTVYLPRWT